MTGNITRAAASALILLSLIALGCGPTIKAAATPGTSFASYKTIAYAGTQAPPKGFTRAELEPDARKAALDAARETLLAMGWKPAPPEEADVIVFAGVGQRKDFKSYTSVTGQSYDLPVDKGAIVIDAFDRKTNQSLWTGQVEGTIKPPIDDLEALGNAVKALMSRFPAPGSP